MTKRVNVYKSKFLYLIRWRPQNTMVIRDVDHFYTVDAHTGALDRVIPSKDGAVLIGKSAIAFNAISDKHAKKKAPRVLQMFRRFQNKKRRRHAAQ
jgi:hypothetical protein